MKYFNIVEEEEKVLDFWKKQEIFKKSVKAQKNGKPFIFYEGPPTANGQPGVHHVISRSFKDIILRYKTMRGFWVWRRAGWDTHGLPVELEVEKELGLKTKKDIEEYGIAEFNEKCRQSVWRYKEEWEKLTERMGFWIDMNDPYVTYEKNYVENLWAIIKKFGEKDLLYEDFKVVPYCVRCGTAVSSHEVAQGYKTVKDRSITAEFRLKKDKDTFLLAWTTTPWTLPGNIALAVGSDIEYVKAKVGDKIFILAKERLENLKDSYKVLETLKGKNLVGLEYEPLFNVPELKSEKSYHVYAADFVSTEEGTGIVHTAVMYGVDDFELGDRLGLPKVHTVDKEGRFIKSVPVVGGSEIVTDNKKNLETEEAIIDYLKEKDLLFSQEDYEHEYPFCWRCKSPLLYYARQSWFVAVTKKKKELVANNKKIKWVPEYIKEGRFGEWLRDAKDWTFSRERYWGTPLPVWRCEDKKCAKTEVVGSLEELNKKRVAPATKFFLMRHGEAISNAKGLISSYPEKFENPITEKGKTEVEDAAKKLKKEKIDIIYASDLTRTSDTAEIVSKITGVKVIKDERLREVSLGELNGHKHKEYGGFFSALRERLYKRPEDGENWMDIKKRIWSFTKEIEEKERGKNVLVVSHGLPLALLESNLLGIETDELFTWEEENELNTGQFRRVEYPNWPFKDDGEVDLHRPYVDEVKIKCSRCAGQMKRVSEVVDVWFDSGAMPFAQGGGGEDYSLHIKKTSLAEPPKGQFPANYISEAIDQTRGWFYTLHTISTLLGKGPSYLSVITNGHVLDEKGKKMSKSVGNVVDPWGVIEKYGIDASRWYFFTVNSPGDPKLFNEKDIADRHRKFIMTTLNSLTFLETYWTGGQAKASENILDKWITSKLAHEINEVTKRLEDLDVVGAARRLDDFVQDLSNWYIRRSRSRLQSTKVSPEKIAAEKTLWETLYVFAHLIAPFAPFLAEILFRRLSDLVGGKKMESVHLSKWPEEREKEKDPGLEKNMDMARNISSAALAERAKENIKVRQKLGELTVSKDDAEKIKGLEELIKEEVNVEDIKSSNSLKTGEIKLNTKITQALLREGIFREITRTANSLRKEAGLTPQDKIHLHFYVKAPTGKADDFSDFANKILEETRAKTVSFKSEPHKPLLAEREFKDKGWEIWVGIKKT